MLKHIISILNLEYQQYSHDEFTSQEVNEQLKKFDYSIKFVTCVGETDKHRWYELRKTVYEVFEHDESLGYVMSDLIIQVYSESSSYEDICFTPDFYECVPIIIQTKTFIKKENV